MIIFCENDNFQMKNYDIFLIFAQNIDCGYMLELPQSMFGSPTRSDTNRAVQPQKMARGLKFLIKEEEGLYYLCSKNEGSDQLLRLCFHRCKNDAAHFMCTLMILSFPTD